jgi:hypothetical protein
VFVSHVDRIPDLSRLSVGHIGVYMTPLLDRTGDVVEQHPTAIDFGRARIDGEWLRAKHASIDRLVVASLHARRRRLTRWLRCRAERLSLTERALQASNGDTSLSQVGLFDLREAMTASAHQEELAELDRMADVRVDETLATSVIDIGKPVLELLFTRRT